ncbi:hypothetical protein [Cryobacterium psychrophilum]|nr:hypothetical protein [Cryobacterium psychrophilum]TDW28806.1 putative spermidine/putrescine transport system permease protein [Cryobacterium psychrophilum]
MTGAGTDSRSIVQAIVLVTAGLLFAVPLVASASFGFTLPQQGFSLEPIREAVADSGFALQVVQSLTLAVLTTVASFVLLIPTLVWLHLHARRWLPLAEALSVIPFVVPAVALVNGANLAFRVTVPRFLTSVDSLVPFYVMLTLPFVTAALLSFTMVLGEYVLATLLLHSTFPVFLVFLVQIGQDHPRAAAGLSLITIVGTLLLLSALTGPGLSRRRRTSRPPAVAAASSPNVRSAS